jgi:hypothetical protein
LEDTVAVAEFIRICDYAFEAGNVLRHIEQRLPRNLKHGFAIRLAQQIGFGFWKRLAAFIRIELSPTHNATTCCTESCAGSARRRRFKS